MLARIALRQVPRASRRLARRATSRASPSAEPQPRPPPVGGPSAARAAAAAGAVGLGAGTLGSCAGVGGAIFVIPGLMRFCGLTQRVAAGNSLVAVTCIASTSAVSFATAGAVDWPIAAILSAAAAVAAPAGAMLSRRVNRDVLRKALAVLVIAIAPLMPVRSRLLAKRREHDAAAVADPVSLPATPTAAASAPEIDETPRALSALSVTKGAGLAAAGSTIGFSAGLLGIGGGNFFTATIALTSESSLRTVLGTSLASMVLPSAVAAGAYLRMGQVNVRLVPPLIVGSVAGAATGSTIALAAPEAVLQWGFAIVFTLLGLRMYRAPVKAAHAKEVVKSIKSAARTPPR